jgi:hypothetical protein
VINARLQKLIDKISQLPDDEQESLAAIIEFELEDEAKWDAAFAASQPQLLKLAEEALEEYQAGKTEPLDPDNL